MGSLVESTVVTEMLPTPRMGQDIPEIVSRSSRSMWSEKSKATDEKCRLAPLSTTHDNAYSKSRGNKATGKALGKAQSGLRTESVKVGHFLKI